MGPALRIGYEGVSRLARAVATVAPSFSKHKFVQSFAARRGVVQRFEAMQRDRSRPLLWMHAPSVGEGLQAQPILQRMRERRLGTQLAYTYFSPSARAFAARLAVDFHDVLPFDVANDMRRVLDALAPSALVFSKLDVWPTLACEAARRGTPLGLVSASLAIDSSRRSAVAGALLRDAYSYLDRVGAVSADDADRLIALGVPSARVSVTGDTRYDQVWARAAGVDRASPLLSLLASERPTLVAGSTWPADEAVLLSAWSRLASRHRDIRLIIAPHEPSASHLVPIERWASSSALRIARLGTPQSRDADVVLVDQVGVLGDLYALASVAFVGGGHHDAGLHSVVEPAAYGVPVLFGPRHTMSRDARLLLDEDAARCPADADALRLAMERWLTEPVERERAGDAARAVVQHGLGAAERSYALVAALLDQRASQSP